ncbi:Ig-like domain-containing protein [Candidatus Gottesmanbacteria bacterium]|nr:Ig-like domain-containing protein [Candidatus Gottesmanbacteria bacterium]
MDKKFIILSSIFFLLFIFGIGTLIVERPVSQFLRAQTAEVSPTKSFFTAVPQVGNSDIKVDVYIRDQDGNVMPGKTVKLSTDLSSVTIEPSDSQNTDNLGKASFSLKSDSPGTANLTVVETTSNVTLTQKLSVEFTNQ